MAHPAGSIQRRCRGTHDDHDGHTTHWGGSDDDRFVACLAAPDTDGKVVFDPMRSFGSPTVAGIRTVVIAEEVVAGSPVESVVEGFGISTDLVRADVEFERAA